MCLGIPMKVISVEQNGRGTVELDEIILNVDFSLIDNVSEGDFVIVHAGFAIEKLNIVEAEERIKMFAEISAPKKSNITK